MNAPVPYLAAWLAVATAGLVPAAQRRIQLEMTSHFADTVEAYRAEGLNEEQASARALADLGDAALAARNFRKTHLTTEEAERLEIDWRTTRLWNRVWPLLGCFYAFLFYEVIYSPIRRYHFSLLLPTIFGALLFGEWVAKALVLKRCHSRSAIRQVYLLDLILWVTAVGYLLLSSFCGNWMVGVLAHYSVAVACFTAGIFLVPKLRLWVKLNKVTDLSRELPPSDSVIC